MFHTAGCITSTLGPLSLSATFVLASRWDAEAALDTIERERVDTLILITTMLSDLLHAAEASGRRVRVRTIAVGGSSVPSSLIERAEAVFGATVLVVYGQTELAAPLTTTRPGDSVADIAHTVGQPLPRAEVRIADIVSGKTVNFGQPGELCARGYQQMIEYHLDPEATSRMVDPDGWLHTGDLAVMDERGFITLTGRLKELIIRGGENIAPAEIVDCLLRHADVADATVVGVPDERLGESVAAVLTLRGAPEEGAAREIVPDVREHCLERLAPYKVPQHWYLADRFPVTPSGKVQGFAVRQQIVDGVLPRIG